MLPTTLAFDMQRRIGILAILSSILLTACQASLTGPQQVDLSKLGIKLTYPEHVTLREADAEYLLKTASSHVFASSFPYHQTPTGVGDWTVTPKIRETLLATKSCDILKDTRVNLPVNTRKPMLCDVVRADGSGILLTLVGSGVPDAALDFLQSSIVLLRPKDFVVVSGLTPFPVAEAAVAAMTSSFHASHPDLPEPAWPNRGFHFLAIDVRAYLDTQMQPPSEEVKKNRELLLTIAKSVTFSAGPR